MQRRRSYPDEYAINLLDADEVVHCLDPTTGRTIWKRRYPMSSLNFAGFNKSGPHLTPCYHDGRVYVMGTKGNVHAIDAQTGATVWRNDSGQRARLMRELRERLAEKQDAYGSRNDFASCLSAAGGVVVVNDHVFTKGGDGQYRYEVANGLVAFDAVTGKELWHRPGVANVANTGTPWQRDGRSFFLIGGNEGVLLLDARTGNTVWTIPDATSGPESHAAGRRCSALLGRGEDGSLPGSARRRHQALAVDLQNAAQSSAIHSCRTHLFCAARP